MPDGLVGFAEVLAGRPTDQSEQGCARRGPRTGYGETKIIECFDFVTAIVKGEQPSPNFRDGWISELFAGAILKLGEARVWFTVGQAGK